MPRGAPKRLPRRPREPPGRPPGAPGTLQEAPRGPKRHPRSSKRSPRGSKSVQESHNRASRGPKRAEKRRRAEKLQVPEAPWKHAKHTEQRGAHEKGRKGEKKKRRHINYVCCFFGVAFHVNTQAERNMEAKSFD